jgi:hypothetical protein
MPKQITLKYPCGEILMPQMIQSSSDETTVHRNYFSPYMAIPVMKTFTGHRFDHRFFSKEEEGKLCK